MLLTRRKPRGRPRGGEGDGATGAALWSMGQFDAEPFAHALPQERELTLADEDGSKSHPVAIGNNNAAAGSARERKVGKGRGRCERRVSHVSSSIHWIELWHVVRNQPCRRTPSGSKNTDATTSTSTSPPRSGLWARMRSPRRSRPRVSKPKPIQWPSIAEKATEVT